MSQTDTNWSFSTYVRRLRIASHIASKKRTPYKSLAEKYGVSISTIKRDVHWIRLKVDFGTVEKAVTDKVLDALDEEENSEVILKYGLAGFLARYVPQRIETKEETTITQSYTLKWELLSEEEKNIFRRVADIERKIRMRERSPRIH